MRLCFALLCSAVLCVVRGKLRFAMPALQNSDVTQTGKSPVGQSVGR